MNNNDYNNIEFRSLRGFLRTVFFGRCYICKNKKKILECHHIDKNSKNNNIFNLVVLCLDCHKLVHKSSFNSLEYRNVLIDSITKYLADLIDRNSKDIEVIDSIEVDNNKIENYSYPFGHPLSDD